MQNKRKYLTNLKLLNIINLIKKNNINRVKYDKGDYIGKYKYNVPANKEWFNSIYTFNKDTIKLLPRNDSTIMNIIKSYFYMFNKTLEDIKIKRVSRFIITRRRSGNKIWVSKPELKHTNDKITITLYVYNKEYNTYIKNLSKLPLTGGIREIVYSRKAIVSFSQQVNILNQFFKNKISNDSVNYGKIRNKIMKLFHYLKKNKNLQHKDKLNFKINERALRLLKKLSIRKSRFIYKIKKSYNKSIKRGFGNFSFTKKKISDTEKFVYYKNLKLLFLNDFKNKYNLKKINYKKINSFFILNNKIINNTKYLGPKYINICKKILRENMTLYKYILESIYNLKKINFSEIRLIKEINYIKYKQLLLFNKFKFKSNFLIPLKRILKKIYIKEIEFNIISLKNFHLSGNILSQIVLNKIKNRKNNPLIVLDKTLRKIKTPVLNKKTIKRVNTRFVGIQNLILKNHINTQCKKDYINNFLKTNYIFKMPLNNSIDDMIIKNIEKKTISGIFLKVSGRITRRIIAERSTYKFRHVGTLKNVNSSFKGLSSVVLRGNEKPNVENTFLNSKNIIGSFGLKGWVASY